jgi:hypothetical protein
MVEDEQRNVEEGEEVGRGWRNWRKVKKLDVGSYRGDHIA